MVFIMADMMISEDVKSLPAAEVRQLPCTVHFSGKANVIQRFDTYMEEASDGDKKLVKAYFRGYPLVGTRIPVPEGYKGIVFTSISGAKSRTLKAKACFDHLTYFNWSTKPSQADPQQAIQEWIAVANTIHLDVDGI
ncbi:uncharacterized protein LOC111260639 isoform X2 [Varroa jacobsoni]|uniref:Uncharacterized protein n=1 Tax=Varroa destructor TaxID=109461 RepID=A0A7M7M8M1_VARDE|nr:uncharacterized protein LOC111243170 isoform X2 [Varroa destructor]XP_022689289.1 uncharacterized protein LOC111260639 isoform X2 [Varroa jacobsoni]